MPDEAMRKIPVALRSARTSLERPESAPDLSSQGEEKRVTEDGIQSMAGEHPGDR